MADENRLENLNADEDKMGGLMPCPYLKDIGVY